MADAPQPTDAHYFPPSEQQQADVAPVVDKTDGGKWEEPVAAGPKPIETIEEDDEEDKDYVPGTDEDDDDDEEDDDDDEEEEEEA